MSVIFVNRAVFIDRDGTIVKAVVRNLPNRGSVPCAPWNLREIKFARKLKFALALLGRMKFLKILVTNQPDVSYGYLSIKKWQEIHNRIIFGLSLDAVYCCMHGPSAKCHRRKPAPGMLLDAADNHCIDLSRSYMIGDREQDMAAGMAVGCTTILIETAYNKKVKSDYKAKSFLGAVRLIEKLENKI